MSLPIYHRSEGLQMENDCLGTLKERTEQSQRQVKRIDVLADDVLLEIFDFHTNVYPYGDKSLMEEAWQSLIHVCRRWRTLVFQSPHRLNLRLFCKPKTPVKDTLDIWPAFPLIVGGYLTSTSGMDNIIAALGERNRIREIILWGLADWQLENVLAMMQVPFPELTDLRLFSESETLPVIPDSFLDGSAPRLRFVDLDGIPFPGSPKLLSSADHLIYLKLFNIPHSGYISPEAIVALISVLSNLTSLQLEFQSPQSRPDRETRRPPPSKRSVIPALKYLRFKGVIEYLEDLVTDIDTPQLDEMNITFFNQIDFDTARLAQFISRTHKLRTPDAHVQFVDEFARVWLAPWLEFGILLIEISCIEPDWQLSSIEQVCNSSLHPLSTAEDLYIEHHYSELVWKDDSIENSQWLQLLLPFTAVENLYLSEESAPGIAATLQELVGDRTVEVLPSLQNILVKGLEQLESGPFQEKIGQFVAARQLSNHTIAISNWDEDPDGDSDSDMESI